MAFTLDDYRVKFLPGVSMASKRTQSALMLPVYCCLYLTVFGLKGALLSGCAQTHKPANVPSTMAVHGDLQAAQQHVQQAAQAVTAAGGNAKSLESMSDRMERKTIIIDRWLETHSDKQ
jgi:hypothetical protein